MARDCGFIYETDNKKPNPTKLSANSKDVGCRSNFDPSRPLYAQDTSFSVKSSLTAVRQGAKVPSSDIFGKHPNIYKKWLLRDPTRGWVTGVSELCGQVSINIDRGIKEVARTTSFRAGILLILLIRDRGLTA